ncbi:MAG: hypothetical protein AB8W33_09900 [Arsenophonus endosymbiont of Dermacentor nuttalli]
MTFSVENILNKTSIWFGDLMHELYFALKVPLTNSSEYFATKSSLSAEEINFFMQNNLALVIDDNDQPGFRLNGVEDRNQDRLDIVKFCLEVREKLADDT